MADVSNLTIKVDSTGVATASKRLDTLTESSKRTDTTATNMAKSIAFAETEAHKMAKGMDRAADRLVTLTESSKRTDKTVINMAKSIGFAEAEAYKMAAAMERSGKTTTTAGTTFKKTAAQSNVVKGSFGAMKGATQQLSFQLQDVAVQAQMGTSAFVILGQQGPQIASIFGPGGAVFGVLIALGAMVGGTLVAAFGGAGTGAKELEDALSRLEGQVVRNTGGTLEFARELEKLGRISSAAATAQIVSGMNAARTAIIGSTGAIDDMVDGITGIDLSKFNEDIERLRQRGFNNSDFVAPVKTYSNAVGGVTAALTEISEALGITRTEALAFAQAAGSLDPKNVGTYNDLRDAVDEITGAQRSLTPEMDQFHLDMKQNDGVIRDAAESLAFFRKNQRLLKDGGSLTGLIEGDAEAEIARLEKLAKEKERLRESDDKALERAQKKQADADSSAIESANKKYESQTVAAERYLGQVTMLGLSEEAAFAERQTRITTRLDLELANRTLSEEQYQAGITALKRESDLRDLDARSGYLLEWQEQTNEALTNMDMMGANMAQNLTTSMSGAFESILTGTSSAKDAFKEFARGMAASMVGALADMAAQWVVYQVVQKLVGKAAQAGEASAMSLNASAAVAMAGLNAFASTAAIPIVGPGLAPAAAAAAIAATTPMATAVAALSGAAVGARALGGQVRGGESYLVGERGPELLHMGTSGRVVPNDKMGGGGSVTIVNNVDASGGGADVDIRIQQAMIQTNRQTVAQVQDLLRRGRLT